MENPFSLSTKFQFKFLPASASRNFFPDIHLTSHNIHQVIITSWGSQPAHSSHHTSAPSCRNTVLVHGPPPLPTSTSPHTVKKRKKSSPGWVMFPLARVPSLRYKAIPRPPLPTTPTAHLAAGNSPSKWGCTVSL